MIDKGQSVGKSISLIRCLAAASLHAQERSVPVLLNHFFVVLDEASYEAVEQSPFLRQQFAANEFRATVRGDRRYQGLYFYGTHTYFEFFNEATRGPDSRGFSMLALGVDGAGDLAALHQRTPEVFKADIRQITRGFKYQQIPWFESAGLNIGRGPHRMSFGGWVMEYDPRFLAAWKHRHYPLTTTPPGKILALIRPRIALMKPTTPKPVHTG